jgi:hypothetical protein
MHLRSKINYNKHYQLTTFFGEVFIPAQAAGYSTSIKILVKVARI